jgi:hypothetical protein
VTALALAVALALGAPHAVASEAAPTLELVPGVDGGSLELRGTGLGGGAALEVDLVWDRGLGRAEARRGAALAGAMAVINTEVAGALRLVAVRATPLERGGVLATIALARPLSPGAIRIARARLADPQGRILPLRLGAGGSPDRPKPGR